MNAGGHATSFWFTFKDVIAKCIKVNMFLRIFQCILVCCSIFFRCCCFFVVVENVFLSATKKKKESKEKDDCSNKCIKYAVDGDIMQAFDAVLIH